MSQTAPANPPIDGFKALAHPLRYRILAALAAGERNVGQIEAATGINQPGLSQQLAILRSAGLVTTRREAKLVYYANCKEELRAVLSAVAELLPDTGAEAQVTPRTPKASEHTGAAVFARITV